MRSPLAFAVAAVLIAALAGVAAAEAEPSKAVIFRVFPGDTYEAVKWEAGFFTTFYSVDVFCFSDMSIEVVAGRSDSSMKSVWNTTCPTLTHAQLRDEFVGNAVYVAVRATCRSGSACNGNATITGGDERGNLRSSVTFWALFGYAVATAIICTLMIYAGAVQKWYPAPIGEALALATTAATRVVPGLSAMPGFNNAALRGSGTIEPEEMLKEAEDAHDKMWAVTAQVGVATALVPFSFFPIGFIPALLALGLYVSAAICLCQLWYRSCCGCCCKSCKLPTVDPRTIMALFALKSEHESVLEVYRYVMPVLVISGIVSVVLSFVFYLQVLFIFNGVLILVGGIVLVWAVYRTSMWGLVGAFNDPRNLAKNAVNAAVNAASHAV